jgi:ornithine decarboxylase
VTPKIARFLAETRPATPCLVFDVDLAAERFEALRAALPAARIYYAIKANPAPAILRRLAALGACFDAASWEEIEMALAAGATPDRISFGNTIKKAAAIARAHAAGVRLFVFDSEEELEKLAQHAPGARVFCRLIVGNEGALWPLSRKFGTTADLACDLLVRAKELGLVPWGVSFHVGSQQTSPDAHQAAIGIAAQVFEDVAARGVTLGMINVGGGFPAHYQDEVPSVQRFADGIAHAMDFQFSGEWPELLVEPGRYIVGDAGVISTEIVLVARKSREESVRWVYLDIGRFGGLSETEGEAIRFPITTERDGEATGPVILAGPTCDSADTLYERGKYSLPLGLKSGDRVTIHTTGAYVTTYATQSFNGFKPLDEHYL